MATVANATFLDNLNSWVDNINAIASGVVKVQDNWAAITHPITQQTPPAMFEVTPSGDVKTSLSMTTMLMGAALVYLMMTR